MSKLKRLEFSYGGYIKRVLLIVLIIFLLGCVSKSGLRQVSAGHIGCSHNNITILDYKSNLLNTSSTWVATCKGKRFICSSYATGYSGEVKCVQEIE